MLNRAILLSLLLSQLFFSCTQSSSSDEQAGQDTTSTPKASADSLSTIYETETLIVRPVSTHTYEHVTFLNTKSFGKVGCNGMIVLNQGEAIVYDTPTNDEDSEELIQFITDSLHASVKAVIATHFHADCLGGLEAFHKMDVPSYGSQMTIELAQKNQSSVPQNAFSDSLLLQVGNQQVWTHYYGEGHTKDNVVGYVPSDRVMFGGCLIKEVGAGKGNLEDANESAWSQTVTQIKDQYPDLSKVIPGHGKSGGPELFDYTIELFDTQSGK